jgi:hypothetical protein
LLQRLKKKAVTNSVLFLFLFLFLFPIGFFNAFFGRFVTRGVQKHEKDSFSKKCPSGLITENVAFFSSVFFPPPSVVWFDFFHRVFGRFVTRGVQKRDKKKSRENLLSSQKK